MKTKLAVAALALGIIAAHETDARACGGCFHPPTDVPTVVTDHRMVFSVSAQQSTLYDQIKFSGSPQSFAWVLPYSGEIDVGVSSDALFGLLDQATQTQIVAPPDRCPTLPDDCDRTLSAGGGRFSDESADGADPHGVIVVKTEVVGPYETKQLAVDPKNPNPNLLNDWLTEHGYAVTPEVQPIITQYQAQHFNFLAVKLVPGAGVQAMVPIRVTTKGANVALPLRMVGAGTGATVGITLWVIAEGRYQPQNFPFFHIEDAEITWDWSTNKSDFAALRTQKQAASNNAIWEVESSIALNRQSVSSQLSFTSGPQGLSPSPDYDPNVDLDVLFAGIPSGGERVTRIRADLAHAALTQDLVVAASPDQAVLSNMHLATKELNEPSCAVYDGCDVVGNAPRSKAIAETNDNNGCTTAAPVRAHSTWMVVALGFVAVALGRKMRKQGDTR